MNWDLQLLTANRRYPERENVEIFFISQNYANSLQWYCDFEIVFESEPIITTDNTR